MNALAMLQEEMEPYRKAVIEHPVYSSIKSPRDIAVFMEHHVFAVWDFMSLLKYLQLSLTCTRVPWYPVGTGNTRYLINEIVAGEESDVDMKGIRKSHFEMYLEAMTQCGADTGPIKDFIEMLQGGLTLEESIQAAIRQEPVKAFVDFTFEIIRQDKPHVAAAVFTFGREDLIPGMFISLLNEQDGQTKDRFTKFRYYLERHIEVDGDHHSKFALEMVEQLCGDDEAKWEEARLVGIAALRQRVLLWDGVCLAIGRS